MQRKSWQSLFWVGCLLLSFTLTGCGDSGGGSSSSAGTTPSTTPDTTPITSSTVSGVAAAGAPLVGYISLRDSENTLLGPKQIADDGAFTFDVTDLVPPFYLYAEGTAGFSDFGLFHIATESGTHNVNPISNGIAAAVTDNSMDVLFDDPTQHDTSNLQENIDQAVADFQTFLQPLLDTFDATIESYLNEQFNADGSGPDQMFDLVDIIVETSNDGGLFQVHDKGAPEGSSISEVELNNLNSETNPISATSVREAKSNLEEIVIFYDEFFTTLRQAALAYAQTSDIQAFRATMEPFFVAEQDFGWDNGMQLPHVIDEMAEKWQDYTEITGLSSLAISSEVGTDHYLLSGNYIWRGLVSPSVTPFGVIKVNGEWKNIGNGYRIDPNVFAKHGRLVMTNPAGDVTIEDVSGFDPEPDTFDESITSVEIFGPGLAPEGVTYTKNQQNGDFSLTSHPNYEWSNGDTYWGFYEVVDFTDVKPYAAYEVDVYASGALLQTILVRSEGGPIDLSTLTDAEADAFFPAVDIDPTEQNITWALSNLSNQNHTFTVTPSNAESAINEEVAIFGYPGVSQGSGWFEVEYVVDSNNQAVSNLQLPSNLEYLDIEANAWSPVYGDIETQYPFK